MGAILRPSEAQVRCDATIELLSKVERPWRFKVTVTGLPPHAVTKVYEISAISDDRAALQGIERFCREMKQPQTIYTLQ